MLRSIVGALACFVASVFGVATGQTTYTDDQCVGINAISPYRPTPEAAYSRDYFYIGGRYQLNAALDQNILVDQMYVEKLTPFGGAKKPYPIVLFTAGVPSGAAWLNTPDNRAGWASYFIKQHYQVYIVDQTGMGRGSQNHLDAWPLKLSTTDVITRNAYTAPEILDPYPQSQNHTQWPGNGTKGDPIFDAFMASFLPITTNLTIQELTMRTDGCALLNLIGPSFTICHSIGCTYPVLISDECPDLVMGSVNLEPGNTPFQSYVGNSTVPAVGRSSARPYGLTTTALNYVPAISNSTELGAVTVGNDTLALRSCILQSSPAHQLPNIAKVPYALITGAASPHITYDHCMVDFLKQAGIEPDWIKLGDQGIEGNGHFLFLEKNNLEIAAVVHGWIRNQTIVEEKKMGWNRTMIK
ncbi:hypothetical protein BLS_002321 [Venturia inaequalis]|uniref:Alpha/beta-hydrolase n=1 Tax=Venturia inaequalis TaxID=5025 RepID=A0A8H3U319_VENIN|nr:hypothetical protein BLS_002321 [Venturia inaequalis]